VHERFWIATLVLTLTWGAGAFGANYPWAYWPLLAACALLGIWGLLLGRGRIPWALAAALASVALAAALQLVPLSPDLVERIAPASVALHRKHDLVAAVDPSRPIALSIDPARTRLGLAFFGALSLLLVGGVRMLTRDSARAVAGGIALLGALLAMVGIVQYGSFATRIYGFWELSQGGEPFGPFVNNNHFAGWMAMGLPVTIGLFAAVVSRGMRGVAASWRDRLVWFSSPEASRAVLLGFAILAMALAMVLTMSRSGMISLVVALLLATTAVARRMPGTPRRVVVAGYLLAVAAGVAVWVGVDRIAAKFTAADVRTLNSRLAFWDDTLRIAADFWLTGTGLNTYGVSTLYYQTALPGAHLREAHNDYLQLAAEGGVLLGVPIVAAIVVFAMTVRRCLREDTGSSWWVRMGAAAGLVAIAVQSIAEFSLQMPGNAALFAVVAAIALHDGSRAAGAASLSARRLAAARTPRDRALLDRFFPPGDRCRSRKQLREPRQRLRERNHADPVDFVGLPAAVQQQRSRHPVVPRTNPQSREILVSKAR
jgi:O-antigen ligase